MEQGCNFYRPATKWREGNVFSCLCLPVCPRGGVPCENVFTWGPTLPTGTDWKACSWHLTSFLFFLLSIPNIHKQTIITYAKA